MVSGEVLLENHPSSGQSGGFYRHLETKAFQFTDQRSFELVGVPAISVI